MNTIKGFLDGHSGRLADLLFALLAVYFGWWLSERARARADRDNGKAELNRQADALVVAVFDLRASAHTGYILWDRIVEHGRTILLASMAGVSVLAQTRGPGITEKIQIAAMFGPAAQILAGDRIASKQYAATVREPINRLTSAAAPLLRHSDTRVSTTAATLVNAALESKKDTRDVDTALAAFRTAVTTATQDTPPWWRRLRRTSANSAQNSSEGT
ncbi:MULTISPECIES: hypothetical protein [unclassified Streptomyces]|uniref:hypothetical protein n=1 Tax=unclassified Streptomyces TaxID=2593676 RepID=UPI002253CD96|nr:MULTISPECIES: hypothetical protein [unclassified Streptomyces]MCX4403813.1 hypothetical protein [Streptomyces sp. NBC_01764]MCX5181236.1 hypothetical protein [Streptomyces sp. NBC_00268]